MNEFYLKCFLKAILFIVIKLGLVGVSRMIWNDVGLKYMIHKSLLR